MVYPSIYETFILRTPHIPNADIATPRFNHSSPHLSYNTLCLRALAALALQRSATGDRLLQPPPTPRPATSLAGAALADGPAQEGHALGPRRLHLVPLVAHGPLLQGRRGGCKRALAAEPALARQLHAHRPDVGLLQLPLDGLGLGAGDLDLGHVGVQPEHGGALGAGRARGDAAAPRRRRGLVLGVPVHRLVEVTRRRRLRLRLAPRRRLRLRRLLLRLLRLGEVGGGE